MNKLTIYSAHSFTSKQDLPFNPKEYSWFKHGCKTVARKFGAALAESFFHDEFQLALASDSRLIGTPIVVLSSPYISVPTATYAMKDYFVERFNFLLAGIGLKAVQEARLYRQKSYSANYGLMSAEERNLALADDPFYCDQEYLQGKTCLFLDDIYITGGHTRRIEQMLTQMTAKPYATMALVYAKLEDQATDPTIEDYLNHHSVKNLVDVARIIQDGHFQLNTRVLKFILKQGPIELAPFLTYMPKTLLETMRSGAIGNGYHKMPEYKFGYEILCNVIDNYSVRPVNQNYLIEP